MSQDRIRAINDSSQDSEDTQAKMQARAAQYTKIIRGASAEGSAEGTETVVQPSKGKSSHAQTSEHPCQQAEGHDSVKSVLSYENQSKKPKVSPDATTMSLDNSADSDSPRVLALEPIQTRQNGVVRPQEAESVGLKAHGPRTSPRGSFHSEQTPFPPEKNTKTKSAGTTNTLQAHPSPVKGTTARPSVTEISEGSS